MEAVQDGAEYGAYDDKAQRARLKEDKKQLRAEEKAQAKERKAKRRALADREADLDETVGSGFGAFIITLLIIVMWLAIMALLIHLDVGGFGSQVLAPVLWKVPVINRILPPGSVPEVDEEGMPIEGYGQSQDGGSIFSALDPDSPVIFGEGEDGISGNAPVTSDGSTGAYIRSLEGQLSEAQSRNNEYAQMIAQLQAEVNRLQGFEQEQVDFERVKADFYEQVIYAENGPGIEEYIKYYEGLDPELAAQLYQEVIRSRMETEEVQMYAKTYSSMKAKKAAAIFNDMVAGTNTSGTSPVQDPELVARILQQMTSDDRGSIIAAMDTENAAIITELMEPETLPALGE